VLKILVGVGLGFLLFTNPEARQITADLLRSTANAIAPEQDGKTFQDRVKDAVVEKVNWTNSRVWADESTSPLTGPKHPSRSLCASGAGTSCIRVWHRVSGGNRAVISSRADA
jgi:hypothetical protein